MSKFVRNSGLLQLLQNFKAPLTVAKISFFTFVANLRLMRSLNTLLRPLKPAAIIATTMQLLRPPCVHGDLDLNLINFMKPMKLGMFEKNPNSKLTCNHWRLIQQLNPQRDLLDTLRRPPFASSSKL